MFDLNFISESGIQNKISDANWSFLNEQSVPYKHGHSGSKQSKTSLIQQTSWGKYAFVLTILSFILLILIFNSRYTQFKPDLGVLNQVINLIDTSDYIINLHLTEANFSMDYVEVTIRSKDLSAIQSLSEDYHMENDILYEMYQKGKFSYLDLIFPWRGEKKGGEITIVQSIANKTVFTNKTSINQTEDIFEIHGSASDIISFLLQMADNKQIRKFNFSVLHQESGVFTLKLQLNHI